MTDRAWLRKYYGLTVSRALYSVQCILHNIHCTLNTEKCTLCTVWCVVYCNVRTLR